MTLLVIRLKHMYKNTGISLCSLEHRLSVKLYLPVLITLACTLLLPCIASIM